MDLYICIRWESRERVVSRWKPGFGLVESKGVRCCRVSDMGGGLGRVAERRCKWRKIASVLVGLSFRELEVSHWCMDLIQEENRSGA